MKTNNARVFLSHSAATSDYARRIKKELEFAGLKAWLDTEDIRPDENWIEEIDNALSNATVVLLLLSPEYWESPSSQFEAGAAIARAQKSDDVRLIPVLIKGNKLENLPSILRRLNVIDASQRSPEDTALLISGALSASPTDSAMRH